MDEEPFVMSDDDVFNTPEPDVTVDDLLCPECGKKCKNARGLSMHLARAHDIRKEGADAKPASLKTRKTNLEKELTTFFQTIGLMVSIIPGSKCMNDGQIIMHNSEQLGKAWSHLAEQNKSVDKFLRNLMSASALGEVIMASAMTLIPILANHEILPSELAFMFGASAPVVTDN